MSVELKPCPFCDAERKEVKAWNRRISDEEAYITEKAAGAPAK